MPLTSLWFILWWTCRNIKKKKLNNEIIYKRVIDNFIDVGIV